MSANYAGDLDPSPHNPSTEQLLESYQQGRALAREYWLFDKETVLTELKAADPALFEERQEMYKNLPPLQQIEIWMAMFHSGMKPLDHLELPIMDAFRLGRELELIDPPQHAVLSYVQCVACQCAPKETLFVALVYGLQNKSL